MLNILLIILVFLFAVLAVFISIENKKNTDKLNENVSEILHTQKILIDAIEKCEHRKG